MHLLLIPSWYSTDKNPIRGSFFLDQALALRKAGHQVGMLVPPSKQRTRHGLDEMRRFWRRDNTDILVTEEQGLPVYRIPWWGWRRALIPWLRGDLGLRIFDRYRDERGTPDIIHGHSILYGGYLAAYIGQKRNIPTVLTEHSTNFMDRLILPGQPWFIRYTLRHTDRSLAVGATLAKAIQVYAPGQTIEIMDNVVDTRLFTPPPEMPPVPPFRFVMVAHLIKRKAHPVLIAAFARAFAGHSDVTLQIAGASKDRDYLVKLKTLAESSGVADQITFLGLLSRQDTVKLIQQGHALVSSSYTESFGVTLIEALACGKPVVATRSGGPEYFINENNGLLVPVGDVDALAAAMQQIMTCYDHYDPDRIRNECVARFSEDAIMARLETVYRDVLAEPRT